MFHYEILSCFSWPTKTTKYKSIQVKELQKNLVQIEKQKFRCWWASELDYRELCKNWTKQPPNVHIGHVNREPGLQQ